MKRSKLFYLSLLAIVVSTFTIFSTTILAAEKREQFTVKGLGHPFGTSRHTILAAIADVHRKTKSWVNISMIETPGAMYMMKWIKTNRDKIATDEEPPWLVVSDPAASIFAYEGRPSLQDVKVPNWVGLYSLPAFVFTYVTFDPNIKTPEDFVGKKVGLTEKARVFSGVLANKLLFEKGLGIWDKVNWEWLGEIGSKNALLNNRIDVMQTAFVGKAKLAADGSGSYICTDIAPTEVLLELLETGRDLYFIDTKPELVLKSFDIRTDYKLFPVLIKKEAHVSFKRDFWGRLGLGQMATDIRRRTTSSRS